MAESGTDKSIIRWTGYIKPSFGEVHTFTIRLNGGNELLSIVEVSGTTSNILVADRHRTLVAEYFAAA